ncbi:hypothetical protein [Cupriavidus lacunae]|uniref:Uncharacterized protein n=1 Tax=Cupriavidus lacunae TaxID=2666307 RepID=A0A370NU57_9BURK|nr:hypothetical protein [Cupriavidus lacunae]RDK09142.1 hypothetical protein DN412_17015 [Cupriavidus lacunae]
MSIKAAALPSETNCRYYLVTASETYGVIAVVEACDEPEAWEFFWAVRGMLGTTPDTEVSIMSGELLPDGVPVFKLTYLKAMQARAEAERRQADATRH